MATKLKNLKVTKVDFVDEGANPEAHIKITKRKETKDSQLENNEPDETGLWKKLASFVGKALGMKQEEIKGTINEVEKEDNKNLKKFEETESSNEEDKGEEKEMKIDKSKMTPAEKAMLEEFEKKYGSNSTDEPLVQNTDIELPQEPKKEQGVVKKKDTEDIYKGLNPEVVEELKSLKKYRAEKEEQELHEVAKRYEIIGKKPEELVPLFKNLKKHGGYEEMVAILDETVTAIEKSGTFEEIGKRGTDSGSGTETITKLKTKVAELRKTRPELTEAQATDEVLLSDDELRAELDV